MKSILSTVSKFIFRSPGLNQTASALVQLPGLGKSQLRVLTYHRIAYPESRLDLDPSLISAIPEQFGRQLRWLSKHFDFVSLAQVQAAVCAGARLPERPLLLTFDDAYQDFLTHALPLLEKYSAPSVLFVPTAYPSGLLTAFWWDRLYCALIASEYSGGLHSRFGEYCLKEPLNRWKIFRQFKGLLKLVPDKVLSQEVAWLEQQTGSRGPGSAVLTWDELRSVAKRHVAIAPHTHTHPLLDRVPVAQVVEELSLSRRILTSEIGSCPNVFAYPSGHYDEHTPRILEQAGYELAFTTIRGLNNLNKENPLLLRRNNVACGTPEALVLAQLAGVSQWFNASIPRMFSPATYEPIPSSLTVREKSQTIECGRS